MAGNNVINYDIKFNADTSNITSKVNELKTTFNEIKSMSFDGFMNMKGGGDTTKLRQEYDQLKTTVQAVDTALTQAFNKDLGTLNVAKFNQSINSSVGGIQNVGTALNSIGSKGQQAFKSLATELLTVNHQLRQSNGFLTSMATTMANTIKWGVASSVMNSFTGTVKKAYGYVKHLDGSLNDIRIVTNKSAEEMDKFAVKANKVAQSLGQTTNAYTEAALIYYQQGLKDVDVEARANVTLKAANVTGQTGEEVSEQLTAVWNGYKVSAEESELYIDKLAAVAANSASNLEELSTGMSKVASAANAMGVDVDQLNAQLSTIISVTRQAPESVGTALKTIYARMSDLKLGETDEDGLGLGDVSGTMESMGIDVMDASGNLRDMGDVIEDVAKKWGTWTEAQQTAMAQAMAGKRQYNNLVALFENWDMYEKSKNVSEGSAGTLQKQQDTYMESTEAHLKQLKAEWEDLYDSLLDSDNINGVVDGLTKVVNLMGAWVDGVGGGVNILAMLGSVAMNVFSRQIATSLTKTVLKLQDSKQMAADLRAEMELTNQIDTTGKNSADLKNLVSMKKEQLAVTQSMTQEEYNLANEMIKEKSILQDQATALKEKRDALQQQYTEAEQYYNNYQTQNNRTSTININSSSEDKNLAGEKLQGIGMQLQNDAKAIDEVQTSMDQLQQSFRNLNSIPDNTPEKTQAMETYKKEMTNTETAIAEAKAKMESWISTGKIQGAEAEKLEGVIRQLNDVNLDTAEGQKQVNLALNEGAEIGKKAGISASKMGKNLKQTDSALRQNSAEIKKNEAAVTSLDQRWKTFMQELNWRSQIQSLTNMIGSVGRLASGLNMLANIPSIFNDESLSAGEKFLRITMAISTAIPMMVSAIGGLSTGYNMLTASIGRAAGAAKLQDMLTKEGIAIKLAEAGVIKGQTYSQALNAIAKKAGIQLSKKEQKNLTAKILLDKMEQQGIKTGNAHRLVSMLAREGENQSIFKTIGLLIAERAARLAANPVFWASVAVIGALTAGIWMMLKAEREEEKRLKQAQEAHKKNTEAVANASKTYNEATLAVKEFKEAIANYKEGVDSLKELDKSTDEYKEKVKSLNDEAKKLIETFGLWDEYSYENGVITFSDATLDRVLKEKEASARSAERSLITSKMAMNKSQTGVAQAELYNTIDNRTIEVKHTVYETDETYTAAADTGTNLGYGEQKYNYNLTDDQGRKYTEYTTYHEVDFTDENFTALADVFEKTEQQLIESGENFSTSSEDFKNAFLANAKATELTADQLDILSQNIDSEFMTAMKKYTESVNQAEQANLHYAKEILNLAVEDVYSDEIIAAATDENGVVDYEKAARIQQSVTNAIGTDELLKEISTRREEMASTAISKISGTDNINDENDDIDGSGGLVDYLKLEASKREISLSDLIKEVYGYEMGEDEELTTDLILKLTRKANGVDVTGIDDPDDGEGTIYYTVAGSDEKKETTNTLVTQEFVNSLVDKLSSIDEEESIQEAKVAGFSSKEDFIYALGNIGPSGFGATSAEMQQFYSNALNTGELDFSSLFGRLSTGEIAYMEDLSPEDFLKFLNITPELAKAAGYETAEDFKNAAMKSLDTFDPEEAKLLADKAGLAEAEKYELDTELFKAYRDELLKLNPELEEYPEHLNEITIANMRMEKGAKSLSEKWKDVGKTLKNENASIYDTQQALLDIKPAIQDILDYDDEEFALLPDSFFEDNVQLFEDVANGVEGSVERLRDAAHDAAAEEYLLQIKPELKDTEVWKKISDLQDKILAYNTADFKIGVALDPKDEAELYKSFYEIVRQAGMSVAEAEEYFKNLGYDVVVETDFAEVAGHIDYPTAVLANMEHMPAPARQKLEMKLPAAAIKVITPNGSFGGGIAVNDTPSDSSTSSGGGGGDDKPDKMEGLESVIDRYHDIENELKKINTLLERQEKVASKLTGKDRIAALQKQIALLKEQNEKQKEKLKLMQDEAAELKKKLQGEGVKFDAEGDISNYKALLKAKEDEINRMIDEYNSKTSKKSQEKLDKEIEKAKEEYEKLREWIERYEELIYDEMPGVEDAIQEAWDKQIELQIEAFEIEIELKLDLQNTKRQLNELMRDIIEGIDEDDFEGIQKYIAKDLSTYLGENGEAQTNYAAWQKALAEYQTIKAGGIGETFGDDANAAWEKVMEYKDATLDALGEVKDLIDQMEENYLNAIENASEEFAKHVEQYEQIQSILDHNLKLIEMLAGDEAYDAQIAYYKQKEQANLGQLDFYRREVAHWQAQKAAAEEGSDAWKEANAKEIEAQQKLNDLVEQSVETIKNKYEATVKKIIKDLNNAVTGGKGLDAMTQEWELINKEAEMYLDTVNSAYEIQKLQNKALEAIDNASSLKAKQRLNEFMEKELGMLKDKEKLSKYEVDRANQLLDIEMKKIALEEAQRNKSTMRLRRDAQGNYSYQYVTDNDAVAKAQQELDEAQNSLYNLDKDEYKANLDEILSLWTDFQTKLNEIWTNNNLTEEQKQQQAYDLYARYAGMISSLTKDNENIRFNLEATTLSELARLRGMDIQNFQNMTDEEKKILLEQMIPQWSSGLQALADQFKDENSFASLMNQAFKDFQKNLKDYQDSLKDVEKSAGVNFNNIISGAEDYSKQIQNLVNNNQTLIDTQATILKNLRESIDATKLWVEEFKKLGEAAKESLETVIKLQEKETNTNNPKNKNENPSENKLDSKQSDTNKSATSTLSAASVNGSLEVGDTATYLGGLYYETSAGGGKSASKGSGKKVTVSKIDSNAKYPIYVSSIDSASGWLKKDQLSGYDTGGYTGDWSSADGKLALLHEKELVLNAKDTENILAAVDVVRSLNDSLNSRIFNLFNSSSIDKLVKMLEKGSDIPLEQNVQITANFPNVSVEREIEEAFNSLINSASQYAFNTLK